MYEAWNGCWSKLILTIVGFSFCALRNVFCPKGSQKYLLQIVKIPKCLDLIDWTMVLPMPTWNFNAKNIPDASKHVPTCFEGPWGRKIGFRAPGPEGWIQVLLNYVHDRILDHRCVCVLCADVKQWGHVCCKVKTIKMGLFRQQLTMWNTCKL